MKYLDNMIYTLEKDKINYIDKKVLLDELKKLGFEKSVTKKNGRNQECWCDKQGDFFTKRKLEESLNKIGFRFDKIVQAWIREGGEYSLEREFVNRIGEMGNKRYEEFIWPLKFLENGEMDYLDLPRHRVDAYFTDMLLGEIEMLAKKRGTSVQLILESIVLEYFELKKIKFDADKWIEKMIEERDKNEIK